MSSIPTIAIKAPLTEVQTAIQNAATLPEVATYKCPGHTEFFHRYMKEKKAEKKAAAEVTEVEKRRDVTDVTSSIISKKDHNGSKSGLFYGLNRVYNYAVLIHFRHKDDSAECPYHPAYKA